MGFSESEEEVDKHEVDEDQECDDQNFQDSRAPSFVFFVGRGAFAFQGVEVGLCGDGFLKFFDVGEHFLGVLVALSVVFFEAFLENGAKRGLFQPCGQRYGIWRCVHFEGFDG